MYEDALKATEQLQLYFRSKDELIKALATLNPEWLQFADRLWSERLVRHEAAIAAIGEVKDGPLLGGVWVGEIGGVAKVYFALMDDGAEEIADYAEWLVGVLAELRKTVDGDGNALWDGGAPVVWRPATGDEQERFVQANPTDGIPHLVCGFSMPTVPGGLCIN